MKRLYHDITIVIPSLEPTEKLITYIGELQAYEFATIIVVNDGSGLEYNPIFEEIKKIKDCIVLTHEVNKGKGMALKTGYAYIRDYLLECNGVITADCDGQHAVEDVCKLADALQNSDGELVIGSRDFSLPTIPMKSRIGNRVSTMLFFCLYGKWIRDTQTGLRGFGRGLLEEMIGIRGSRFEYEMQVMITCIVKKIPINQIEIQTIYDNNNVSTHFQACRDSIRVVRVIVGNFIKFISSSGVSAIVDLGIAWYLLEFLKPYMSGNELLRIGLATCLARMVSLVVNFLINKMVVFEDKKKSKVAFPRYLLLCIFIMLLSTGFVYGASQFLGWEEKIAKLIGDCLLFSVSYHMQRSWVFDKGKGED